MSSKDLLYWVKIHKPMSENALIKEQLAKHLGSGEAFMSIPEILSKISYEEINTRPSNLPYSFYELFFHIVCTQKDIVKFTCSDDYTEPKWPDYYWPKDKNCRSIEDWESLKSEYFADRDRLRAFIIDDKNNLTDSVKNGSQQQTILREVLLVVEHTAYHSGQMLVILRLLNLH